MFSVIILPTPVAYIAGVALVGLFLFAVYILSGKLFMLDERIEDARRMCAEIATFFTKRGFGRIPKLLMCIVVFDVSGLIDELKAAYQIYSDPVKGAQEMHELTQDILTFELNDQHLPNDIFYEIVDGHRLKEAALNKVAANLEAAKEKVASEGKVIL